ncbi:hypothetical protein B0H19DRAFT_1062444 [Mycena capillaripes]|nr:hypothetical protein B0H19DRAFT_1062444 [Mycena capillaripes]
MSIHRRGASIHRPKAQAESCREAPGSGEPAMANTAAECRMAESRGGRSGRLASAGHWMLEDQYGAYMTGRHCEQSFHIACILELVKVEKFTKRRSSQGSPGDPWRLCRPRSSQRTSQSKLGKYMGSVVLPSSFRAAKKMHVGISGHCPQHRCDHAQAARAAVTSSCNAERTLIRSNGGALL